MVSTPKPVIKIIEQPASTAVRFRYGSEGPTAGSILGASTTPEMKTFPTVRIEGYRGKSSVYLVVSCVTEDDPYMPHPHNLVGKTGCHDGVCRIKVPSTTMTVKFTNLGIQCVKRNDVRAALKAREKMKVDPFNTGFRHRRQPMSINLNVVRLCFQAFSKDEHEKSAEFVEIADPVVSEPIYDKKNAPPELSIFKLSDRSSPVDGGEKDIILLCDKVSKDDIAIRFFEVCDGDIVWDVDAKFDPSNIHKQTALWFRAPAYRDLNIAQPVKVFVQLYRPNGGGRSAPEQFEIIPRDSGSREIQPINSATTEPRVGFSATSSPYNGQLHGNISPTYPTASTSPLQQGYHVPEDIMVLPSASNGIQYGSAPVNLTESDLRRVPQYNHNIPNHVATENHHGMAAYTSNAHHNERILFDMDGQHLVFPNQNNVSSVVASPHVCVCGSIINTSIPNGLINQNNPQMVMNQQAGYNLTSSMDNAVYQAHQPSPNSDFPNPDSFNGVTSQQVVFNFTPPIQHISNAKSTVMDTAMLNVTKSSLSMDCQSIPSADSQELLSFLDRYQLSSLNTEPSNGGLDPADLDEIEHVSDELYGLSMYDQS